LLAFVVRRLIHTVVVIFLVSGIAFSLLQFIPGDPVLAMLGEGATPQRVEALRKELWLDRPVLVQYGHWINNVLHGDLGKSITYFEDVTGVIARTLPKSAYLAALALALSVFLGIFMGIISAIRRGTFLDNAISILANLGISIPTFWLGLLCIYLFGYKFGWLPIQGFTWPTEDLGKSLAQSIMPVVCLAVPSIAMIARQTRSSMLEVIRQDYIRTAKSKGLKERVIVMKHALKNALIPVVTLLGILVRILIAGAVLIETVFNIPGLGRLLVNAAFAKDFIVIQAGVLVISAITCFANLAVDISYGLLDPRTRYE
jgi:peptide/nickel transport system permease protein